VVLAFDGPRVAGGGGHGVVERRLRGYSETLAEAGIDLNPDSIAVGSASIDGGNEAFDRLWDQGRRPTAVLAMSDAMAIGAIRAIHQRGHSVPGEISVVGFDDVDLAASTDPPLTTVHQPVKGKGDAAVRLLLSVMEGGHSSPVHRRLETRLVIRSSTGPASQAGREVTAGRPKSA
jgi:DNA-binding LacI/PurR family transcriptional regulator